MGKKKGFCSFSPPFPGSHSYYDICLERQVRRDTLPFLSVTGATGIHNLLYKPEGSWRNRRFVLLFIRDSVSPQRLPDKHLSSLVCLAWQVNCIWYFWMEGYSGRKATGLMLRVRWAAANQVSTFFSTFYSTNSINVRGKKCLTANINVFYNYSETFKTWLLFYCR